MAFDVAKFKDLFITEAEEHLANLSTTLLEIEKDPSHNEQYEVLMQNAHTIKGSAATMGYEETAQLAHALEDVFHMIERGALHSDSTTITALLGGVDMLATTIATIKKDNTEPKTAGYVEALRRLLVGGELGEHVKSSQPLAPSPQQLIVVPNVVKVGTEKLDALMGIFEDLLMLQLKLNTVIEPAFELLRTTQDQSWKKKLFFINEFRSLLGEMSHLLSENQDALLTIRLVSLDQIFGQYPRMVRDLAVREGKKIEFVVRGGDVALDRTVIDGLGGALAHLLRNAVDHGIATTGTIVLSATSERGRARIIVEDNGRGIDYQRVREVAYARGVETKEHLDAMNDADLAEIIFHPNMSTNNEVTDVSGRGVGVSAVHGFARDMGGRLEVISPVPESGVGTRFTIDLPISLATVRVLMVDTAGFIFAIPFENIERTHEFLEDEVSGVAHQETLFVDGELIPLLRLERELGLSSVGSPRSRQVQSGVAILISASGVRMALSVDKCVGEQELLVKSLPPILRGVKGFSGSALLPDGRTILLLDVHGLLTHAVGDILEHTIP